MNEQNNDIETKWVRNCPNCNKILIYKTRRTWNKCSKENTLCIECGPKKRKDKNILIENATKIIKGDIIYYIRKCPKCNKEIEHKNKYSYIKGLTQNKDCNYCSRQKLGLSNKNKIRTEEVKNKISKSLKGIIFTDERNEKISSKLKGRNCWVWRKREIIIKSCLYCLKEFRTTPFRNKNHHFCNNECKVGYYKQNKKWIARFNPIACQIIEEYGKEHGYNFQHALNGGEYYIKELKYWLDGYDEEKNVVIEYMEKHHKLTKEKDIKRKELIIKFLNCKFIEIYE